MEAKEDIAYNMVGMCVGEIPAKSEELYYSFTHNDPAMCLTLRFFSS